MLLKVVPSPYFNYHLTKYKGGFALRIWEPTSVDDLNGKPFLWMTHQRFQSTAEALKCIELYESTHRLRARYSPLLVSFRLENRTKLISDSAPNGYHRRHLRIARSPDVAPRRQAAF